MGERWTTRRNREIVLVSHVAVIGGAATMVRNMVDVLREDAWRCSVVCPNGEGVDRFRTEGVSVVTPPWPIVGFAHTTACSYSFLHPRNLQGLFRVWRSQNVWCDYFKSLTAETICLCSLVLAPMAMAARRAGKKVVCLVQETGIRGACGLRTAWLRHTLSKYAHATIFISEYDKLFWRVKTPIVEVVANWVDIKKFDAHYSKVLARNQVGIPLDARVVLFMGGVCEIKGTSVLLKAIDLMEDTPNVLCVIAGYQDDTVRTGLPKANKIWRRFRGIVSTDYHKRVKGLIQSCNLEKRLLFTGVVGNVVPLYAASDIVVFPAVRPHQARPLIEAGAMAKPVIISDFSNIREYAKNNCILVPPNDPCALASAIRNLLDDPVRAEMIRMNNYCFVLKRHSVEENGALLVSIFNRVVGNL